MGDVLDLSLFALPVTMSDVPSSLAAVQPAASPPTTASVSRQINAGEFLSGPIHMGWIEAAARLPGAALPVALLVRHLHVMRGREWVVLSNVAVKRLEVSSSAKARAVAALEEAGLIVVQRQTGSAPRVKPVGDR